MFYEAADISKKIHISIPGVRKMSQSTVSLQKSDEFYTKQRQVL